MIRTRFIAAKCVNASGGLTTGTLISSDVSFQPGLAYSSGALDDFGNNGGMIKISPQVRLEFT